MELMLLVLKAERDLVLLDVGIRDRTLCQVTTGVRVSENEHHHPTLTNSFS